MKSLTTFITESKRTDKKAFRDCLKRLENLLDGTGSMGTTDIFRYESKTQTLMARMSDIKYVICQLRGKSEEDAKQTSALKKLGIRISDSDDCLVEIFDCERFAATIESKMKKTLKIAHDFNIVGTALDIIIELDPKITEKLSISPDRETTEEVWQELNSTIDAFFDAIEKEISRIYK